MKSQAPLLSRIERQYGVPGAVVVAIWGLETDFGAGSGHEPTLKRNEIAAADFTFDREPEAFNRLTGG